MKSLLALVFALSSSSALACGWYTHTVADELGGTLDVFHLVVGDVPHHTPAYWRAVKAEAKGDDKDARVDRAYADLQLGDHAAAQKQLLAILAEHPGDYPTLSNLGVNAKKMGALVQARAYLAKALEKNPAGHLGLGDLYLKGIDHRIRAATGKVDKDFLGRPYGETDRDVHGIEGVDKATMKKLKAMMSADPTFADVYLVVGDALAAEEKIHLAVFAYERAKTLGHPRVDVVDGRIAAIIEHWEEMAGMGRYLARKKLKYVGTSATLKKVRARLSDSGFRDAFAAEETALLKSGRSTSKVQFKDVERALKRKRVTRKRVPKIGVVKR